MSVFESYFMSLLMAYSIMEYDVKYLFDLRRPTSAPVDVHRSISDFHLWFLTGETRASFNRLVEELRPRLDAIRARGGRRITLLNYENQILLTLTWLRSYPCLTYLSLTFGIPDRHCQYILDKMIPVFHMALVPKYIQWHNSISNNRKREV